MVKFSIYLNRRVFVMINIMVDNFIALHDRESVLKLNDGFPLSLFQKVGVRL